MRNVRIAACLAAALVACGGDDSGTTTPDASGDDATAIDATADTTGSGDATNDTTPTIDATPDSTPDASADTSTTTDAADASNDTTTTSDAADAAPDARSDAGADAGTLALGATCTANADCASNLCKPFFPGAPSVCTTACTQQSDCASFASSFCDPSAAGATSGVCVPRSPAHCMTCTTNADCGSYSEACFQAPGDVAAACHVDCAISGASACPPDYSCVSETVGGTMRQLCRPTGIASCLDALGGYCDRVTLPEACSRTNSGGTCNGQRTCVAGSQRFSACNAMAPQCKTDCALQDPAGCTETFCSSATSTVANCGTCGNVCPGNGAANDNVTCNASQTCTFSCQGEHYDVNGNPADGCEIADTPLGNHTQATAAAQTPVSICGTMTLNLAGQLPSDARAHENPTVGGFSIASGSAPDWLSVVALGSAFCQDDIVATLQMTGGSSATCYSLTVITDKFNYSCATAGNGSCSISHMNGQMSDYSTVYFEVSKTCSSATSENVTYTIKGNF